MLMSPNEDQTAVHGCYYWGDMVVLQPRPQGFSLKKWVAPHPFFEGKALGTRLGCASDHTAELVRVIQCLNWCSLLISSLAIY